MHNFNPAPSKVGNTVAENLISINWLPSNKF
jgi:hypothetical protein